MPTAHRARYFELGLLGLAGCSRRSLHQCAIGQEDVQAADQFFSRQMAA